MSAVEINDEATLLAMPEADYMNALQLAFFRRRLLEQREEIETHLEEIRAGMGSTEYLGDDADRAASEEDMRYKLRQADRESRLLGKIDETIERIDEGDYGYCEETGEPIGLKRLLLRPTATLSIEAKERREQQEHHFARRHSA